MRAIVLLALLLAGSAASAGPDPGGAAIVEVRLSSFDFSPETIRLRAGEPVVLHLVNSGRGGHNFSAPQFFAAATLAPGQAALVRRGTIEVPSRRSVQVRLVPARGRYPLRCTHTLHTVLGMRGEIVVE